MKTIIAIAALVMSATLALADTTIQGCAVVKAENGNYYNLVDPTCEYAGSAFDASRAEDAQAEREAAAAKAAS